MAKAEDIGLGQNIRSAYARENENKDEGRA